MLYTYTLAFIMYQDNILLINRKKKPWLGAWNGLGGKIQPHEHPDDSVLRELYEETGFHFHKDALTYKGYLTWNTFDANGQGLYIYLIKLDEPLKIQTPLLTDEGILDFKSVNWIMDPSNMGIAHNIPYFLPSILESEACYHFHCTFKDQTLVSVTKEEISCHLSLSHQS